MSIKIIIPSYKRCGKITTLDSIPISYKDNTFLFVRKEEYDLYYNEYKERCNIIPLENVNNICETRKRIVEYFDGQKIWMLDDDLVIYEGFVNFFVFRKIRA